MTLINGLEKRLELAGKVYTPPELDELLENIKRAAIDKDNLELQQTFEIMKRENNISDVFLENTLGSVVTNYSGLVMPDFETFLNNSLNILQIATGAEEIAYFRFYPGKKQSEKKENRSIFAVRAYLNNSDFWRDIDAISKSEILSSLIENDAKMIPLSEKVFSDGNLPQTKVLKGDNQILLPVHIRNMQGQKKFFGVLNIYNKEGSFSKKDFDLAKHFSENYFSSKISEFIYQRRDKTTKAYNKDTSNDLLLSEVRRLVRSHSDLSVIIADIDHFKKINDTKGHNTGDYVLKQFAKTLYETTRETDRVCRYGGEEFLIILPNTKINEAYGIAERLRETIDGRLFDTKSTSNSVKLTSSFGVQSVNYKVFEPYLRHDVTNETLIDVIETELVKPADDALYEAKKAGRNCVWPPLI